ncbi:folylpolyglutamate synthase [Penicillium alfredii]|uniref:tetrahydrofolate synthase n=1 Tax=Penicillium alfredii TaxID=1506179 RepID=A0A9W9G1H5_9EURO|nr:folylpolyglutamate synthase [Penicillium alfredii]KAJ5110337.1 folylpolyglutamate synthase [Penicillium alfredii]
MQRNYESALRLLETRRRNGRPAAVIASSGGSRENNYHPRGLPSLHGMKEWLGILGYTERDINGLNIVHITGTKGKGSTCAFTRCLLRAHGLRTGFPRRIGLYTSPHLRCIRERIQIDDQPITEDLFTKYFFEVWERLFLDGQPNIQPAGQPRFLQLLALTAFHTFLSEKVEAAIFETHHGGEYDATNVIERPVVSGVTSLGLDHVAQLGPTVEDIAWHKAGIFKTGSPAFSVQQEQGPRDVMKKRAEEKGTTLDFVPVNNNLLPNDVEVLGVPVQRINFSLAIELSRILLQAKAPGNMLTNGDISCGVERFSWPGRFEIITEATTTWLVDGAHNELSVGQAAEWYANVTRNCPVG